MWRWEELVTDTFLLKSSATHLGTVAPPAFNSSTPLPKNKNNPHKRAFLFWWRWEELNPRAMKCCMSFYGV